MAETQEVGADALRRIIERVERLNEDAKAISDDKREVFAEAKSMGFDPKVIRRVVAIRSGDKAEMDEFEALVDTYLRAVGHSSGSSAEASAAFNGNSGDSGEKPRKPSSVAPPPPADEEDIRPRHLRQADEDAAVPAFVRKGRNAQAAAH